MSRATEEAAREHAYILAAEPGFERGPYEVRTSAFHGDRLVSRHRSLYRACLAVASYSSECQCGCLRVHPAAGEP